MSLPILRSISTLILGLFLAAAPARAAMSRGFNQLLDAVVRIDVREVAFESGTRRYDTGIGSGVILSEDGLVLTNAHVASPRAVDLNITLSSLERVSARLIGWDHWTDLALLRIDMTEARRRNLKFAHADLADSNKLFIGQPVYAVGTPFGLSRTLTRGIISNNHQYLEDLRGIHGYETGLFNTWLQTDAAINPGNSGGPLANEDGKVVGISTRAYMGANNLGFAVPANIAKKVVAEMVRAGAVTRSYIGLVPRPLQDYEGFFSLALNTGMLIDSVDLGSPAAKAGLRAGDVLLSIDGEKIDGRFPEQLPPIQNIIASQPVGASLKLGYKRGALTADVSVVTEKLESRVGEEWAFEKWGLSVRKVSRAFARANQLTDESGVLVIGVQSGFPADIAGLVRGDLISKINQAPVTSLDVLKSAHAAYEAQPAATLLEISRSYRVSLVILKP